MTNSTLEVHRSGRLMRNRRRQLALLAIPLAAVLVLTAAPPASSAVIWWPWRTNSVTPKGTTWTAGNWTHWAAKSRLRMSDNPTAGLSMSIQIRNSSGAAIATASAGGWSWANLTLGTPAVNSRARCWWTSPQPFPPLPVDCQSRISDPGGLARTSSNSEIQPERSYQTSDNLIAVDVPASGPSFPKSISLEALGGDAQLNASSLEYLISEAGASYWRAASYSGETCLIAYDPLADVAASTCTSEKSFSELGLALQFGTTEVRSEAYLVPPMSAPELPTGVWRVKDLILVDELGAIDRNNLGLSNRGQSEYRLEFLPVFDPK